MFLVKDSSSLREERILQMLTEDASLSLLLSVIHFEWTVRRAIIALGISPNVEIREKLEKPGGIKKYKQVWKEEVFIRINKRLPEIVTNWDNLKKAFKLRNKLIHGVGTCSQDYAMEKANYVIESSRQIREIAAYYDINLDSRLPIRRKKTTFLSRN